MACAQCEGIELQFSQAAARKKLQQFRRRGPLDGSTAHLAAAREETERRGHVRRVEFVHGDFVDLASAIPAADVVTLDRVICCYHEMERLLVACGAQISSRPLENRSVIRQDPSRHGRIHVEPPFIPVVSPSENDPVASREHVVVSLDHDVIDLGLREQNR